MSCASGSTQCFQDVKNEKLSEDQNDHWLLLSGIGQSDCKSDENEWIKPTVIGYLVGQLIGAIFELNFGRDLNQDSTVVFVQFSRSINIRNVIRKQIDDDMLHFDSVPEIVKSRIASAQFQSGFSKR
uniref:Bm12930, isoform c n=1 Tax=Brugia malayi TaxID=6279 RepID=A0A1I9G699_BRUMA|nr:Bm12930, isoform c [Brugia malayi]